MFRFASIAAVLAASLLFAFIHIGLTPAVAQNRMVTDGDGRGSFKTPQTVLERLDADGDGRVSRSEWRNPAKLFNSIDTDADGWLTYGELQAHFADGPTPGSAAVEWIDVHAHPTTGRNQRPDAKGAIDAAVAALDASQIAMMILMPQPMVIANRIGKVLEPVPVERWIDEARRQYGRFYVMGGGGSLNAMIHDESPDGRPSETLKKRFAERAEAILNLGAVGFGEIALTHFSMVPDQPYMSTPADHPLLLMLTDIAAQHGVVIDVHFDPVLEDIPRPDYMTDDNPAVLRRNIDAFERFLDHNRAAKISWAHVGSDRMSFWTAKFTRNMLAKHPNLYMSLRLHLTPSGRNFPLSSSGIKADWMETFEQFPDRFVIGSDQFFISPALAKSGGPSAKFAKLNEGTRNLSSRLLGYLPPEIARKFAFDNAMQLYGLTDVEAPENRPSAAQSAPSPRQAAKAAGGLCRDGNMAHCEVACRRGIAAACARLKRGN